MIRHMIQTCKMDGRVLFMFVALNIYGCWAVDSLRFLVMGDWGGLPEYPYDTPIETSVAKQMASITEKYQTSFNLALGDNFYFDGVKDVEDKRFFQTFENVYHYDALKNPWYFIAGNHDHNGNVSAEIAYTKQSTRWRFPDYYYNLTFPVPGGKTLGVIMLDTILLCGNTGNDLKHDQPHGLRTDEAKRVAADQWAWLENQLQTSKADYLIVAGHFPVLSIAEHGPTECLVDRLEPLLRKYNVTAYFCGHDHNLQHLRDTKNGQSMNYFVSGAANFVENSTKHKAAVPAGSLKFFWAELVELGGFSYVEATAHNMTYIFVDGLGKALYRYELFPRT